MIKIQYRMEVRVIGEDQPVAFTAWVSSPEGARELAQGQFGNNYPDYRYHQVLVAERVTGVVR
jgi:hypothetical protein